MGALCAYLLLASILTTGCSLTLKSSHSNVISGLTDNVTLQCFYEKDSVELLSPLSRIRLLKLVKQKWKMYAQILHSNPSQPILSKPDQPRVSVSGRLRQPSETSLTVTWLTASDDTAGSYKCEVDGFAPIGNYEEKFTQVITITNNTANIDDLLDIIAQVRRRSDQMSRELQEMDGRQISQGHVIENRIINNMESVIENHYFEVRHWPTGTYGLLTDAHGCPDTPFSKFSEGHFRVHVDRMTQAEHVFPARFNCTHCNDCNNLNGLHFHFCTSTRAGLGLEWPKGSYCIHRFGSSCPVGFNYGYIQVYLESLVNLVVVRTDGDIPFFAHLSRKYISPLFCCRIDGKPDAPIVLPDDKPFYLYRFGGLCQTVLNMDVSNETIVIDTDKTKTTYLSNTWHPDGTFNNVTLELCYYTKRNMTSTQELYFET